MACMYSHGINKRCCCHCCSVCLRMCLFSLWDSISPSNCIFLTHNAGISRLLCFQNRKQLNLIWIYNLRRMQRGQGRIVWSLHSDPQILTATHSPSGFPATWSRWGHLSVSGHWDHKLRECLKQDLRQTVIREVYTVYNSILSAGEKQDAH